MSQDPVPAAQVHNEEDGHKVFVGNLSFSTTEAELTEHFSKPNPVVRADIITRRFPTRSKGYGFVLYETLAHAELAAQTYDKTELGGRTLIVEVATPKGERPRRERAPRPPKEEKENKDDASAEADADTDAAEVKPRTGRNNRGPSSRKRNKPRKEGDEGKSEATSASAPPAASNDSNGWGATPSAEGGSGGWEPSAAEPEEGWGGSSAPADTNGWKAGSDVKEGRPRKDNPRKESGTKREGGGPRPREGGRRGGKRGGGPKREGHANQDDRTNQESTTNQEDSQEDKFNQEGNANQEDNSNRETSQRRGGGPRRGSGFRRYSGRRAPRTGPLSKTTVFVANIPYSMDDEGLKALFANYKVVAAHAAFSSATKRPRGFGFVEFADEAEQLKVLEELKQLTADGRELSLKPALAEEQITSEKETGGEASA